MSIFFAVIKYKIVYKQYSLLPSLKLAVCIDLIIAEIFDRCMNRIFIFSPDKLKLQISSVVYCFKIMMILCN